MTQNLRYGWFGVIRVIQGHQQCYCCQSCCDCIFTFYSNYARYLVPFQDRVRHWLKITNFLYHTYMCHSRWYFLPGIWHHKTRFPRVSLSSGNDYVMMHSFSCFDTILVYDRQTDGQQADTRLQHTPCCACAVHTCYMVKISVELPLKGSLLKEVEQSTNLGSLGIQLFNVEVVILTENRMQ